MAMPAPTAMESDMDAHPEPYIHLPLGGKHTHTLILLHGTSQTGPTFASALLSFRFPYPSFPSSSSSLPTSTSTPTLPLPDAKTYTLPDLLPTTKFIFPTGSAKPLTVFHGAPSHAWFDIHDFTDRTIGEADQVRGMKGSVAYLSGLIAAEEEELLSKNGRSESQGKRKMESRVAVLGFSQGCAMGIMMVLAGLLEESTGYGTGSESESEKERAHAAPTLAPVPVPFIGLSGWLPFRIQIEECLANQESVRGYVRSLLDLPVRPDSTSTNTTTTTTTPPTIIATKQQIHLAHGSLDVKVKLEWAQQMVETLRRVDESRDIGIGLQAEAKVYEGLAHWFNEAEMAGVVEFLGRVWGEDVLGGEARSNERRERGGNVWRRIMRRLRRAKVWIKGYCERGLKRKNEKSMSVG